MFEDATQLAHELTPYAYAAIGGYGAALLSRGADAAADSTISFGHRLLRRLAGAAGTPGGGEPTAEQIALVQRIRDVAQVPQDADAVAALRWQIRRLLAGAPELAAEVAAWPRPQAPGAVVISTTGERSPAVQNNYGHIHTGDTACHARR